MRISAAGLELIKSFEGFRETAVRIPDGRWTIGHGHVRTAREGLTITAKDAEDLLRQDLRPIEAAITSIVYAPLIQGQFDALVSLAFNISLHQFRESDIVQKLNAGDYLAAANGFDLWRKARLHGRVTVVDALVRRRAAEKAMFLDHPSGRPSAPTPLVTPQIDLSAAEASAHHTPPQQPHTEEFESGDAPSTVATPEGDLAEAVRRLAEQLKGAVLPPTEIPLPPGAVPVPPAPPEYVSPDLQPEQEKPPVQITSVQPDARPQPAEVTPESVARASQTMAERVARILSVAAERIEKHEAAAAPAQAAPVVREGLPDFDAPAEKMAPAASTLRTRRLIDDTEIVAPGHDPAVLFANGERQAKVVNGHAKRIGPVSGRLLSLAPWIAVLVLSLIGFAIGMVDTLKGGGIEAGAPRLASTVLAVFGVMSVMSVYYILRKRGPDET